MYFHLQNCYNFVVFVNTNLVVERAYMRTHTYIIITIKSIRISQRRERYTRIRISRSKKTTNFQSSKSEKKAP